MSLINDALRRATTNENPQREKELPPMEPTFRPARAGGAGFSIFVVCFLIAAALTLGLWIYWRRGLATAAAKPAPAPAMNTNNNPIARAEKTFRKVEALNKEGENEAEAMQKSANAPTTIASAPSPAAPVTASAGGPKLQGIFYSANNPSAIINGQTMKVGDEHGGLKLLEIKQRSVRVQSGGETRELTMK
jgi:MSHA biogenesis protein MshK